MGRSCALLATDVLTFESLGFVRQWLGF